MKKILRLFIAVQIPDTVKTQICAGPLSSAALNRPGIRPVPAKNLHLTLHFIGDTPVEKIPQIDSALDRAIADHNTPFDVRLEGAGVFPNLRNPRVFWLGLNPEAGSTLSALAKSVKRELRAVGIFGDPKPFRPHLTIARVSERFNPDPDAAQILDRLNAFNAEPFEVSEIACFTSDLSRGKPIYEKVIRKRMNPQIC